MKNRDKRKFLVNCNQYDLISWMNRISNKSTRVPIQILLSLSFCHALLCLKLAAGFLLFCQRWGGMVPRDNLPQDNVPVPQVNPPRGGLCPGQIVLEHIFSRHFVLGQVVSGHHVPSPCLPVPILLNVIC